jgi:hypothetical protein
MVLLKKKFWDEIIRLHKPTVNNFFAMITMEHKQSKPTV